MNPTGYSDAYPDYQESIGLPSFYDQMRTRFPDGADPFKSYDTWLTAQKFQPTQKINVLSRFHNYLDPTNSKYVVHIPSDLSVKDINGNFMSCDLSREFNMGIIPVRTVRISAAVEQVAFMGFIVKNEIGISTKKRCVNYGSFLGFDPSFSVNKCSFPITAQKHGPYSGSGATKGQYPTGITQFDYMSSIKIGANDIQLVQDPNLGKYSIKGLHTSLMTSNGAFSRTTVGEPQDPNPNPNYIASENNPTQEIVGVGISRCDYYWINNNNSTPKTYVPPDSLKSGIDQQRSGFISSQSGVGILGISVNNIVMNPFQPNLFEKTLLNKLGFELSQLIPYYGNPYQNINFNRGYQNKMVLPTSNMGDIAVNSLYPQTTNNYFTATETLFMVVNSADYDMANLGSIPAHQEVSTNSESDEIIAYNLANKLDFPFLVIYSDIIPNVDYYGGKDGNSKIKAMAYITRNYAEGDYFYSFATSWNYTIDKAFTLTNFRTEIRQPDGRAASIEDNSSIIYRITKRQTLPPDILDAELEADAKKKKSK